MKKIQCRHTWGHCRYIGQRFKTKDILGKKWMNVYINYIYIHLPTNFENPKSYKTWNDFAVA